jgi:rubrerythrin
MGLSCGFMSLSGVLGLSLRCCKEFEELTGRVYEELSVRVGDPYTALVLKWLSLESYSHAKLMESLYNTLKVDVVFERSCRDLIGRAWEVVEGLLNKLGGGDVDLTDLLGGLEFVEGFIGEETYSKYLYSLIKDSVGGLTSKLITEVLSEVVEEERYHERLVKGLIKYLSSR